MPITDKASIPMTEKDSVIEEQCDQSLSFERSDEKEDAVPSQVLTILCGTASGLAATGLQNLVQRLTNISLPDNDRTAWQIIEPHFSRGPPRIRFEAVFDIIQQHVDPNLALLDNLTTHTPAIDRSHEILAMLAQTSTVITTDFDHRIEDAGRLHLGNDPNVIPFDVFCTEEHFRKAYESIRHRTPRDFTGLWKIHGTVAIWKDKEKVIVRADEDGGPVATLKKLSITRESIERRSFLHHLLETRTFIIFNYSATDDFDVARWLKTVQTPLNVLWIQQLESALEPVIWNGIDIAKGVPSNINSFDRGLVALACAWHEHGIADRLTVVTTADSTGFLIQKTGLTFRPQDEYTAPSNDSNNNICLLSTPTRWHNYIISGALLSHLSYFSQAKHYFDHATNISIVGTREYCIARLAAAEASIEIGDRNVRIEAMNDALDAADAAPRALNSWADRKAQLISATVKRFVEKDGQAIAIDALEQLLDDCGLPEDLPQGRERNVAIDAAMALAQLRRFLPSSAEPSEIARQWIELIPKTGLLQTKGINLHESALNKYQVAGNKEDIADAINIMKEAIEIREELGHMRGLVASLNVLGSMQMRHADWSTPVDMNSIEHAAEQFRRSIDYSDKHASVFDQFQARIHLAICLLRYPSMIQTKEELQELLDYFQTRTTDDLRTCIEKEFCLAMSIFLDPSFTGEASCDKGAELFQNLADAYTSNKDARLIRILAAARFNAELCRDWKQGQVHPPNSELTQDITTRKTSTTANAYWLMRIFCAETRIPIDNHERLQLLLDPLSP